MPNLKIFVATVYGGALDVAEQISPLFEQAGFDVEIFEQPTLDDLTVERPDVALFCISTTGSGDYPGNFMEFANALHEKGADLNGLRYGLIAMGDSSYDTFCGAGRKFDALLQEYGATRVGERFEIDAMEDYMADEAALPWAETWIPELKR
ncbi:flavodoxin domain-containing protein [Phytohalomonas tamaricis]|uniref:flavodoxin domain-containing protein n=1 Tax=Phytohalomonas tamaricis TaxID=2081032 RepID=UPI000D0BE58D|nr:flavodoxin domain-containing protein [Phytohalomonas tamaricis]